VHYTQTILEVNNILIHICKKTAKISTATDITAFITIKKYYK